jgi:hypothetical protein
MWSEAVGPLTPVATVAAPTVTTVASSANPSLYGKAVTYTATVSPTDGGGTVAFSANGSAIPGCGTQPLTLKGTTATATCQVTYTTLGSRSITASYSGDSGYGPSTSSRPLTQVVEETPAGLCQLTVGYAEGSAKYLALKASAQKAINETLAQTCNQLAAVTPRLLVLVVAVYKLAVAALAHSGWLTSAQAGTLSSLAGDLTVT